MKEIFKQSMENERVLIEETQTKYIFKQAEELDVFNFYFEKDGKKFFFKSNSKYSLDVSELLSYALDREVDKNAVAFLPAVFKTKDKVYYGSISEDIAKNNKECELVNGASLLKVFESKNAEARSNKKRERFNTIEHYKLALGALVGQRENLKISLDKNFFLELAKHMISGFIRADEDLHAHNIPIIIKNIEEKHKLITLGKLFDKSMSFLIKSHRSNLREDFENLQPQKKFEKIEQHLTDVGFPFQVKASSNRQTSRQTVAREIAELIVRYPELNRYYQAYKSLNIKRVFTNFKNENNYHFIKDSDIELADMVVKSSLKLLDLAIEYVEMQSKGFFKFLNEKEDKPSLEF